MWKNYLLVALRSLRRRRGYAALNVLGLAVGMACCILIALFVRDELSYDRFHPSADRIVRMGVDFVVEGEVDPSLRTQGLLASAMAEDLPAVERAVQLIGAAPVLRVGDQRFEEDGIVYASPALFEVFDGFTLLHGDRATALDGPNRIVLSASLAEKYFGTTNAVGEVLRNDDRALTVAAVMADLPSQSHLQFDGAISLATAGDPGWWYNSWFSVNFLTYARLRPDADLGAFRASLPAFMERQAGDEMREMGNGLVLHAEALTDVYLRSDRSEAGARGSRQTLTILGAVALFVLLIACVNFTNLATARSVERAREVGVRKTLGATRSSLAAQFLAEAVLLSTAALVLALGLVQLALPAFAALSGKALGLGDLGPWLAGLGALVLVVGVLAGMYPALVLSRFEPSRVLKGRFATSRDGVLLRRGLVVLQFGISVVLIAGTAVVFSQLSYMQQRDLGFALDDERGELVAVGFQGDEAVTNQLGTIKERFAAHPAVTGVTSSITVPAGSRPSAGGAIERPEGGMRDFSVQAYLVDTAFVGVYGMEIIAGRAPGAGTTADSLAAYVLNETAVREAGYPSPGAALGREARFWGFEGEVVGVVRDFHTSGLQAPVEPLALVATDQYQNVLTLRIRTDDLPRTLAELEAIWTGLVPQRPFSYSFLDEDFGAFYEAERRFGRLFGIFAGLAVFVACLGLFGLAAYTAQQRTKEIGVRKVLGASTPHLVGLLTKDTVALVAVAFVVAAPVAWLAMDHWLDGFAYRVDLGPGAFLFAGALALAVALVTVSVQALRTASVDPVRALRYE